MTPIQRQVLNLIVKLNGAEFAGDFLPSEVMAFCQVESAFRPNAYRKEPSGVASYGLMQVLDITARPFGVHNPGDMYDPETSLRVGMKVLNQYWDMLTRHFHREPYYEEWSASYNEGPGNVFRGRADDGYVNAWLKAQEFWAAQPGVDDVPGP